MLKRIIWKFNIIFFYFKTVGVIFGKSGSKISKQSPSQLLKPVS